MNLHKIIFLATFLTLIGGIMINGVNKNNPDSQMIPETPELPEAVWQNLPHPVIDEHPEWISLYRAAWKFMYEKITSGNTENGFVESYIDEGFNENIYQWDSCFMVAYAIYGLNDFPAMATLDNFYNHQRVDGYICRCYNQDTGFATGSRDLNPPLFAWMEWRYYKLTGDFSRLQRVLPVLDSYYRWIINNVESPRWKGLYYNTDFGSGMDNSPRGVWVRKGAWIDMSSQQALSALYIQKLAEIVLNASDTSEQQYYKSIQRFYHKEYRRLKKKINKLMWNDEHGNYYDRREDGRWHVRNTIASFWPLLADICNENQAYRMINMHLKNPDEFYRKHLFPTLAANDPFYKEHGHYWRGGVWAPTNFVTIKGLAQFDLNFAREAAINHIEEMSKVYHSFNPDKYQYQMPALDEPNIPRNGNGVRQIWEAYAPDYTAPATRWDAEQLVRQKFCGWSGVGPVALLIEIILGFETDAESNTVIWYLSQNGRHGIENLIFNGGRVSLVTEAWSANDDEVKIHYSTEKPIQLVIYNDDGTKKLFNAAINGKSEISISITNL